MDNIATQVHAVKARRPIKRYLPHLIDPNAIYTCLEEIDQLFGVSAQTLIRWRKQGRLYQAAPRAISIKGEHLILAITDPVAAKRQTRRLRKINQLT